MVDGGHDHHHCLAEGIAQIAVTEMVAPVPAAIRDDPVC
jgi:hypothetical protein